MSVRVNVLAAFAAACLSYAAPAVAQERVPVIARVSIADLDLAHAAGMATLRSRIARAAWAKCDSQLAGPAGQSDAARCRHEMEQDGIAQIAARGVGEVQVAAAR